MWQFYILLIFIFINVILFSLVKKNQNNSLLLIISTVGLLGLLSMLRSVDTGNDTNVYVNLFYNILNGVDISSYTERYEIGYLYLNKILGFISSNHQILLIFTSIYIFFIVGRFIYKYSNLPWLSVILFLGLRYYDIALSGIRQMLAIATILIAFEFIVKKMPVKFLITTLLATLFHSAAYIFLLAYPLSKLSLNKKLVAGVSLVAIILYMNLNAVLDNVLRYFPRYNSYIEEVSGIGEVRVATFLGLVITVVVLVAGEIMNRRVIASSHSLLQNKSIFKTREDQIMSVFLLLSCAIMFIALKVDIFQRLENVFSIFAIVYLPNAIMKVQDKYLRALIIILVVVMFLLHILAIYYFRPEWQSTFPVEFFWSI